MNSSKDLECLQCLEEWMHIFEAIIIKVAVVVTTAFGLDKDWTVDNSRFYSGEGGEGDLNACISLCWLVAKVYALTIK